MVLNYGTVRPPDCCARAGVLAGLTDYLQFTLLTTLLPPLKRMFGLNTTSHRLTLGAKRREICEVVFA